MENNHLIIMAGGVGSRFWPMSTPEKPKQFIDVLGLGHSLIQMTYDRFAGICRPEHVWVVTAKKYAALVHEQLPEIPVENILLEPCMRNTAPCIAYVAWKIKARFPDANLVVTPSDAVVMNTVEFARIVKEGLEFTSNSDSIVTLGIEPNRPETGYGYIQRMDSVNSIAPVSAFKEKPSLEVAEQYLAEGGFYWNAGIFIWNVRTIEASFRAYEPGIADVFDQLAPLFYTDQEQTKIDELFPTCKAISIDYAVMEPASKNNQVYVLPSEFGWSDLGTWGSLHERLGQDACANAVIGDRVKLIESSGCIVHVPSSKRVVIQGLDGFIVAEHGNTLLICEKKEEQRIKEFSL